MPDMLIRSIAPNVKSEIEKRAKASGRSLSDEAKHLLRVGLEADRNAPPAGPDAYDVFRAAFADCLLSDEEHAEFTAAIDKAREWKWRSEGDGQ
jgi:antitoxin FitA